MHLPALVSALTLAGVARTAPVADRTMARAEPIMGQRVAQKTNGTAVEARRFIIEFDGSSDVNALAAKLASQANTTVLRVFDTAIFKGASVSSSTLNADSLSALLKPSSPTTRVWSSNRIRLAKSVPSKLFSPAEAGAAAGNYSIHWSTGVDKLHAAGYTGKGATVAIVDTGTWYTHPALGGGFGPGYKVKGGLDLVGDGYWPDFGEKEPDADPVDIHGHGTHVAGIVAGKTDFWKGVAPDAEILSYKVFTNSGSTDEDTLIAAFLEAYKADADIITASIGGPSGFADNAWAVVASRLVESGTIVTIAAGNDGEIGPFFASNGAAGRYVLSVASVEASTLAGEPFSVTLSGNGTITSAYLPSPDLWGAEVAGWPVWPASLNTSDVMAGCYGTAAPDLSKTIPIVPLGGCEIEEKQAVLEAYGARYIMFYNDDSPLAPPFSWKWSSSVGLMTKEAGHAIISALASGQNVTFDFSKNFGPGKVSMFNSGGGVPSYFTTYGALYDLSVKPDVAAPGGNIWSTYLNGQYAIMSGTSMATPYVAGIAALWVGKTGGRKAAVNPSNFAIDAASRIASSGAALPWSTDGTASNSGFYAPVDQVGTGLVRADKVLGYTTSLSYSRFALNDTANFARTHSVDITNSASSPVEYRFTAQPAGGYEATTCKGCGLKYGMEVAPLAIVPGIQGPASGFVVGPGETKTAQFVFDAPATGYTSEDMMPVYSGKILVTGSNGESLSVPYFGLATSLSAQMGKIFGEGFPYSVSGIDWVEIDLKNNYTFDLSLEAQDFPRLWINNKWGITSLRWDIFTADWTESSWSFPPVPGQSGYIGSATGFANADYQYVFNPEYDDPNNVFAFPVQDEWRTPGSYYHEFWWLGRLSNGSQIAPGDYTMRVAALAPFADPGKADSWDSWVKRFTVLPKP